MTLLARQHSDATATDAPALGHEDRTGPDVLRALSQDAPKAVYSTVVLAGLVTAAEWFAIAAAGVIPYAAYVVPNVGPQPPYFAIIGLAATLATVIFHAQRLYTSLAFRRPVGACLQMAGPGLFSCSPSPRRCSRLRPMTPYRACGWPPGPG